MSSTSFLNRRGTTPKGISVSFVGWVGVRYSPGVWVVVMVGFKVALGEGWLGKIEG